LAKSSGQGGGVSVETPARPRLAALRIAPLRNISIDRNWNFGNIELPGRLFNTSRVDARSLWHKPQLRNDLRHYGGD